MGLLIAFIIFICSMLIVMITGHSMIWALLAGLIAFAFLGYRALDVKGFAAIKELSKASWITLKESFVVIEVMLIIGFITAAWRVSGTITVFVYYGMKVIVPSLFLLIAFLLACILSYALGTSFGVAGTVGVIFMALARSGDVNPAITGGVLLAGIYFGDRCSPVSSSANMVAGLTKTDVLTNVKLMMKTGLLPLILSIAFYTVVSIKNPLSHVDENILSVFQSEFSLSIWGFLPAILMIALPLLKCGVVISISISILSASVIAILVEHVSVIKVIQILFFGYEAPGEGLGTILNGGGMCSMIEIAIILAISSAYSGIFNRTGLLDNLLEKLERASSKVGRFTIMIAISTASAMIFCNQTIATLICNDLFTKPYENTGGSRQELAIDIENSVIVLAGIIPWCIACSVPLTFFDVNISSIPWAAYIYLVPICYFFTKRFWFEDKVHV